MLLKTFCVLLFAAAVVLSEGNEVDPQFPNTTTVKPASTVTSSSTTSFSTTTPSPATTTPSPATTTPSPATTTPSPATTTPSPATTTPSPATTTPSPATTTPSPATTTTSPTTTFSTTTSSTTTTTADPPTSTSSTTTTAAPSTTPLPPSPEAQVGNWSVTDDTSKVVCIIAEMAIQLNVTHPENDKKHIIIDVPTNASDSGSMCGNTTQMLTLSWNSTMNIATHNLTMTFEKNATTRSFALSHIEAILVLDPAEIPGLTNRTILSLHHEESEFTTPVEMSYRCAKAQSLNLTSEQNETIAELTVSHSRFEAFHNKNSSEFGVANDCESSDTLDIVPIAVGCALVGLVIIVLIAYVVGRRRSQARGYLSM